MVLTTPFHERLAPLNQTHLWSHWSGYLSAVKYQMADKFEYFAVRNAAGLIDTSPLYKYRIGGRDATKFLGGVLARDIGACRDGQAQYTLWCDERGYVVEDGVVIKFADDDFILTSAEPNLAYFRNLIGYDQVEISDVSGDYASLAVQGPRSGEILAALDPVIAKLGFFHHCPAKIGNVPVHVSRTGYTGDLGYELWVGGEGAIEMWDTLDEACTGRGVLPVGQSALLMTRIEAGLVLIGVDFHSSRFAFNDHECSTPIELGFAWMFRDLATSTRRFIGRAALERELADKTSRWKMVGLVIDWRDWDRHYGDAGLIPPKDETPVIYEMMLYDGEGNRVGYTTSFMYSPMLQRHIAMARVQPELAAAGSRVNLEITINHRYHTVAAVVARPPLFNPPRKTA
ncbi:MAG: aminomethyltransferase family protein [Actinomycetota bacterium]|nr:aminomethyltransferase family protein [Actinomycetota bacterium]